MCYKNDRISAVLIPHAGGSAAELREFSGMLQERFDVISYELPGRGRRRSEPSLTALEDVLADLMSRIPDVGPIVIIGYSFGAYLGLLAAHRLREADAQRVVSLVLLANEPIHKRRYYLRGLPEERHPGFLRDFCVQMGGVPESIMADNWLSAQLFKKLAEDLLIADQIPFDLPAISNVSMLVVYGRDDPLLTSNMTEWPQLSDATTTLLSVSGGHFVLESHSRRVFNELIEFHEHGHAAGIQGT
ncbi:hypothetical protein BZK31_14025 [Pseudomonas floridensis]|uniref:Thioesterase domain-containing protein n=1 Tax=Pseudomonas floridensis TaxID=1958950 RepID=A0A1X0N5G8_9PSED|nr:alpha/beta fold hydrolase [Pseudomonas floridensis]ORC58691.1 hypothetical protein BZK31_14025 [Pseudomonas floridensis]